jgi:hypothetical protein
MHLDNQSRRRLERRMPPWQRPGEAEKTGKARQQPTGPVSLKDLKSILDQLLKRKDLPASIRTLLTRLKKTLAGGGAAHPAAVRNKKQLRAAQRQMLERAGRAVRKARPKKAAAKPGVAKGKTAQTAAQKTAPKTGVAKGKAAPKTAAKPRVKVRPSAYNKLPGGTFIPAFDRWLTKKLAAASPQDREKLLNTPIDKLVPQFARAAKLTKKQAQELQTALQNDVSPESVEELTEAELKKIPGAEFQHDFHQWLAGQLASGVKTDLLKKPLKELVGMYAKELGLTPKQTKELQGALRKEQGGLARTAKSLKTRAVARKKLKSLKEAKQAATAGRPQPTTSVTDADIKEMFRTYCRDRLARLGGKLKVAPTHKQLFKEFTGSYGKLLGRTPEQLQMLLSPESLGEKAPRADIVTT